MIRRTIGWAILLLMPGTAAGQGLTLAPFAAVDRGLDAGTTLAGVSATAWSGPLGLRLGGALDLASTPVGSLLGQPDPDRLRAWSADLDMILSGGRLGLHIGGVRPGVFIGLGLHGRRVDEDVSSTIAVWSYGLTAGLPLTRWLEVAGEARYRMPHESDPNELPTGVAGGLELRAGLALHLGNGGTGRTASRTSGAPTAPAAPPRNLPAGSPADAPSRAAAAEDLVGATLATGRRYVGVPYAWGGDDPSEGFDCSGFVQYVYGRNGIALPRVSRQQARAGTAVSARITDALPGDLLFFAGDDGVVTHVAIYVGGDTILHAADSGRAVGYLRLTSGRGVWYATHLVAIRRVIH